VDVQALYVGDAERAEETEADGGVEGRAKESLAMETHFDAILEDETLLAPDDITALRPIESAVLGKAFEGKQVEIIAKELDRSIGAIRTIMRKPAFHAAVRAVQENQAREIARGEFGVMAFFKSKSMGAAKRLYRLSKDCEDDRVSLTANLELLKFAGIRQPAPQVTENIDRLIDQFTAAESIAFAERREWPTRFTDQLARLSVNVIREHEQRGMLPTVEDAKTGEFDPT